MSTASHFLRAGRAQQASRQSASIPKLSTAAVIFVLLAYMPILGRADPTSSALSISRVLELLFLTCGGLAAYALRGRKRYRPLPTAMFWLSMVVVVFAAWAMVTSLIGPFVLIGLVKALQLMAICFIASEVAQDLSMGRQKAGVTAADIIVLSVVAVVALLILSNILVLGTPLPMSQVDDWPSVDPRPRLILGDNHPLSSALLLAIGVISCLNATMPMALRLPMLLGLGGLLYLCNARGIAAGCTLGVLFSLFCRLPRSPYKLLAIVVGLCAITAAIGAVLLTQSIDDLVVSLVGRDAFTLNSRIGLWSFLLAHVPDHPVLGVGYYSTRAYSLEAFPFAGHAHNSAIEVLFSTGLVGAALFALFIGFLLFVLAAMPSPLLIGVAPIVFFEGSLNPVLFQPGVGMFLLMIILMDAILTAKWRS